MLRMISIVISLSVLAATSLGENLQSWSHHTYMDEPYSLKCDSDTYRLTGADTVTWTRQGESDPLTTDEHYALRVYQGVADAELYIRNVTYGRHGIYVCHITDRNQVPLDNVVRGLNLGTHLYHDDMDKYRDNIVVGAIAAGSTIFLIVSVCLISQFRYLSEESLEKRRQRKDHRLSRESNGVKNKGYDLEMTETSNQTNGTPAVENSYVHF